MTDSTDIKMKFETTEAELAWRAAEQEWDDKHYWAGEDEPYALAEGLKVAAPLLSAQAVNEVRDAVKRAHNVITEKRTAATDNDDRLYFQGGETAISTLLDYLSNVINSLGGKVTEETPTEPSPF